MYSIVFGVYIAVTVIYVLVVCMKSEVMRNLFLLNMSVTELCVHFIVKHSCCIYSCTVLFNKLANHFTLENIVVDLCQQTSHICFEPCRKGESLLVVMIVELHVANCVLVNTNFV